MYCTSDGWINLDKPAGITSACAVAKVKRLLTSTHRGEARRGAEFVQTEQASPHPNPPPKREKIKIGHAGTLDPLASGILPLAVGKATKLVGTMMDAEKSYAFTVTWGQERTTDDAEGEVTKSSDKLPTIEEITKLLPQFTGKILQTPPNYSAIKLDGKRAYDLARKGQKIEIKPREVFVKSLAINPTTSHQPLTTNFICYCGKGVYIRSIARDMGRIIGCYGYVSSLRRLSVGKFDEHNSVTIEQVANSINEGKTDFLQPIE